MGKTDLTMNSLPPSLNVGTRGRGIATHRRKKQMEEEMVMRLLASGVPKDLGFVRGTATLRFPTRHRRDSSNFGWLLGKALGDALSPHSPTHPHRWLPDDTAEFFEWVEPIIIEKEVGAPRTILHLVWLPSGPA